MTTEIRQEINLLQNSDKNHVPIASFSQLIAVSFLFSIALSGYLWASTNKLEEINKDIASIEKNNMFQQNNIVNTGDLSKYQQQLKNLEKQLLNRYQLWADYQQITVSGKGGFSTHFYHIANLATQDLSLYEIDIYNKGKNLSLSGYARRAEDIPTYINELKQQQEFSDVAFGNLLIEKLATHNIMKFSLEKIEEEDTNAIEEVDSVDAESLMEMPLANKLDLAEMLKKTIIDQGRNKK